jgi:hypothetical protein
MAKHKTFTVATNVKVYFCGPHSPYQARVLQAIIETLGAWGHFAVYNRAPMRGVADI